MPDVAEDISRATAVLTAFAAAMARWEADCAAQSRARPPEQMDQNELHDLHASQRAACQAIFDRHCTNRPRGNHRPAVAHHVEPSTYAPGRFQIERVEFDKSPRIHAHTTQGPAGRFRFTLVRKPDGWRIDQREVWTNDRWTYTEL